MSQLDRLKRRREKLNDRRKRQVQLFHLTDQIGHKRRARDLGRQVQRLDGLISEAERKQRAAWKIEFAARFIAPFEGLRTEAYLDSGGVWTIGYGHTGKYAFPGNTISKAFAFTLFMRELRQFAREVRACFTGPLSRRQFIAAISLGYNIGIGGLKSSTFLREFNAGNIRAAADALLLWVKDAAGNTLPGLLRRRRAERWLILHPRKGETIA